MPIIFKPSLSMIGQCTSFHIRVLRSICLKMRLKFIKVAFARASVRTWAARIRLRIRIYYSQPASLFTERGAMTMAKQLQTDGENDDLCGTSAATHFNSMVIKKLRKALLADASVDLLTVFPREYSK